MPERLRVSVLGLTHDHVWGNIPNLQQSPNVEVVGAGEAIEPLREQFEQLFPEGVTCATADDCLEATHPDAVLICASNARSVALVEEAAAAGCHCIVEKPMANNLAGAERMLKACDQAGVRLIINWPIAWNPSLWHAARLAQSGDYGPIWQVRFRAMHNGPKEVGCSEYFVDWLYDEDENGPGAFMDYCCYGAAMCSWLQGLPQSVVGLSGRLLKTEDIPSDNAVLLLRYPHALSVVEASWTNVTQLPYYGASISCAEATFLPEGDKLRIGTAVRPEGEMIDAEDPPEHLRSLGHYLVALVRGDVEPAGVLDARVSRDAQAILEAGWQAASSGEAQPVQAAGA